MISKEKVTRSSDSDSTQPQARGLNGKADTWVRDEAGARRGRGGGEGERALRPSSGIQPDPVSFQGWFRYSTLLFLCKEFRCHCYPGMKPMILFVEEEC